MADASQGGLPTRPAAGPPPHLGWGSLDGVRVVEFGHFVAGPYCGLQLAYYGAEVVKIESRARPDMWRLREGETDLHASVPFADHNKNKLSLTVDIKEPAGRDAVLGLVAASDAVVENFSHGVLERLGLGYEDLRAVRPDLVMVSLQGFGRSGELRDAVALGPSLMAYSGLTHLWSEDGEREPVGSQTSYPDYIVGVQAAFVLLAALAERDRTGRGVHVEFAQFEAVLNLIAPQLAAAALGDSGSTGSPAPSGAYPCMGEDAWCVVEARDGEEWAALLAAVPELAAVAEPTWTSGERTVNRTVIDRALGSWTRRRTPRAVMEELQAAGVPAGAVLDARALVEDPHLAARGFAAGTAHPVVGDAPLPGPVARHLEPGAPRVTRHAPLLGQDRRDVLGRVLGLTDEQISAVPD